MSVYLKIFSTYELHLAYFVHVEIIDYKNEYEFNGLFVLNEWHRGRRSRIKYLC